MCVFIRSRRNIVKVDGRAGVCACVRARVRACVCVCGENSVLLSNGVQCTLYTRGALGAAGTGGGEIGRRRHLGDGRAARRGYWAGGAGRRRG